MAKISLTVKIGYFHKHPYKWQLMDWNRSHRWITRSLGEHTRKVLENSDYSGQGGDAIIEKVYREMDMKTDG